MPASQPPTLAASSSSSTAVIAAAAASPETAATQYTVEEEMATVKVPMLRPRPALLKILHLAGGVGDTFTMGEIINHVKEYILDRRLYDEQDPRIVHCGQDLLGTALGVDSFTVHDALNLFHKNCTMEPDSCIRIYRHLVTRPANCHSQVVAASNTVSYITASQLAGTETAIATSASVSNYQYSTADQSAPPEVALQQMTEDGSGAQLASAPSEESGFPEFSSSLASTPSSSFSSSQPSSSSSSSVIKFQAPGLYVTMPDSDAGDKSHGIQVPPASSSSDSGDKRSSWEECQQKEKTDQSNRRRKGRSTSISVTYDEPDGAVGPWTCQMKVETSPGEAVQTEDDTLVVEFDSDAFSVEYDVESDSEAESGEVKLTENSSDESSSTLGAAVLVICEESDVEYLADYSDSDNGTDLELAEDDNWQCEHCLKKNPPFHRNCGGCWSLRPDWLPSAVKNSQDGTNDILTTDLQSDKCHSLQSQGQQISSGSLQSSQEQKSPKHNSSPVKGDKKSYRKRKCSSSLSTSDSQDGKVHDRTEQVQQINPGMSDENKTVDKQSVSVCRAKDDLCVVCLVRKKNASIVHKKTGHQACCYRCASRLKQQRKPCPICRRPIQKVIRNYLV